MKEIQGFDEVTAFVSKRSCEFHFKDAIYSETFTHLSYVLACYYAWHPCLVLMMIVNI